MEWTDLIDTPVWERPLSDFEEPEGSGKYPALEELGRYYTERLAELKAMVVNDVDVDSVHDVMGQRPSGLYALFLHAQPHPLLFDVPDIDHHPGLCIGPLTAVVKHRRFGMAYVFTEPRHATRHAWFGERVNKKEIHRIVENAYVFDSWYIQGMWYSDVIFHVWERG